MPAVSKEVFPELLIKNASADHVESLYALRKAQELGDQAEIAKAKRRSMELEVKVRQMKHGY